MERNLAMFESIKTRFQRKKDKKISKREIVALGSVLLAVVTCFTISNYNPGNIVHNDVLSSGKKVSLPKELNSSGPRQQVDIKEKGSFQRSEPSKQVKMDNTTEIPNNFFNNLPTTLPNFTTTPSLPRLPDGFGQGQTVNNSKFDANMVYAHHVSVTDKMKEGLSPLFKLEKLSEAPKDGHEGRFITSFAINDKGNISEKFELMSIVRTTGMSDIKTAMDVLNALVEESESVNIIEATDSYLIYDFAGSKGYQIGKITLDNQGIYIFGYINLTTNNMPSILKNEWISKMMNL